MIENIGLPVQKFGCAGESENLMSRKERSPKPVEQRIEECETHLYFLWDARRLYEQEKVRYKQIAAELRVLVGDHRPKRRLLLSLMDEHGFTYDVQPPGPPFEKQDIPMVGWRDDPIQQALTAELQDALGDDSKLAKVLEKQAALRRPVPFPEYVEKALAVYSAPYDYSYRDLVLAVSQQVGSGHEDTSMDEPLMQMRSFIIGGDEGHVAPLIGFCDLVLRVGRQFLGYLAEKHGYKPRHFRVSD